jgi:YD repeat-containing protein
MKKTPFAASRNDRFRTPSTRKCFSLDKMGISRFGGAFLILALLAQALATGPIQSAKASGRIIAPPPVSARPEPFLVQGRLSGFAQTSVLATTLLAQITNLFTKSRIREGFSPAHPLSIRENLASGISSMFAFLAPKTKTKNAPPNIPVATAPMANQSAYDFDGDGKADIGRWHPANHTFEVKRSDGGGNIPTSVGNASSIPVPGNYDGGTWDAAVFTAGIWNIVGSEQGNISFSLGAAGDIPVSGDYDGDGLTDAAVFHAGTSATWNIRYSDDGEPDSQTFGTTGDIPIPGDYDNDGTTDLAIYRIQPVGSEFKGFWHIRFSSGGEIERQWGSPGDLPVQGNFDEVRGDDLTVYRPSNGTWYVGKMVGNGMELTSRFVWGSYNDQPAPADYNGDGTTDYCVWRPTTGVWHIYYMPASQSEIFEGVNYETHTLGVLGDRAIPSAYTKQIGGTVTSYEMAAERLKPRNATGGTNLYSQNFSWGTSLVGLPGRAGLMAGFGISYNSLVWIKSGSAMYFDPDVSNVSPGFRFGFAVIEPIYFTYGKGWSYMMVTPDGGRTEFLQQGVSNYFETVDSSFTQLKILGNSSPNSPVEDITMTVTTTDGTQMSYVWDTGAYRCTKIKDRNGNFITNTYTDGRLTTVTDTLGRVVTVNYNNENYPTTITQAWNTGTHTWATLSYVDKTVDTDFGSSLAIFGPPDTTVIKVLDKIKYADDSVTIFHYNDYLQVKKIENFAADNHRLNYVRTNLESVPSHPSDCPRVTDTYNWVENFNLSNPGQGEAPIAEETHVTTPAPSGGTFSGPNGAEPTAVVTVSMANHPNQLYSKMHFGASGWKEGLPIATEDFTDSGRKRWTWTNWDQDVAVATVKCGVSSYDYLRNPRVTETQVGDNNNNIKRTTMNYVLRPAACQPTGSGVPPELPYFGLVSEVDVYDTDLETVIKKSVTEYNLDTNYLSRRIVGLPSQAEAWGKNDTTSALEYVSKVTYAYDEGNFNETSLQQTLPSNTTQHDDTNYGSSFIIGRGNITSTTRHAVLGQPSGITSSVKYNTAGAPVSQTDPLMRTSKVSYADNFTPSGGDPTYAYPTMVTDSGGNSSTIQYRYDFGANVWARSPKPEGDSSVQVGKTTSRTYNNTTGRIERETILNTGAYTRYEYSNTGTALTTYSTIVDVTGVGEISTADEVSTETLFDGAGRVRKTRTANPDSIGGYTGKLVEYNILGQVKRETVPTEMDSDWNRAGDDAAPRPWLWNWKFYDWKGRVTRNRPSDSDGIDENKDTIITYEGCGCAGGQVTTISGPITQAIDMNAAGPTPTPSTGRRVQKIREDILGRTVATEVWSLNGGSLYSTTVNHYNGRDQVTDIIQYAGAEGSSTPQITSTTYDGHGRPSTMHRPEYAASTYTTTTYNLDDTVATVRDPRGAITAYTYENVSETPKRPLVTNIHYATPNPNATPGDPLHVAAVPDVTFQYDNAGNRTLMSDDTGDLTYTYDELSRMKTETKDFLDNLPGSPSSGVYTLTYNYHLSGGIQSITEPFGHVVNYSVDKLGRTTGIGDASISTKYVHEVKHRAFGAVKGMKLTATQITDSVNITYGYDSALRLATYQANSAANVTDIHHAVYAYNSDGMVGSIDNQADAKFDQTNQYDFAGRLRRNDTGTGVVGNPFLQKMKYDAFNNLTYRETNTYQFPERSFEATYANNRKTLGGSSDTYDASGNVVQAYTPGLDLTLWKFDASGRTWRWEEDGAWGDFTMKGGETVFDGDGRAAKQIALTRSLSGGTWEEWNPTPSYYIYSSVTGQKITDLDNTGASTQYHVYMGSSEIADVGGTDDNVNFHVNDPVTGSMRKTNSAGVMSADDDVESRTEIAGMGTAVPPVNPTAFPKPRYQDGAWVGSPEHGCTDYESMPVSCSLAGYRGVPYPEPHPPHPSSSAFASGRSYGRDISLGGSTDRRKCPGIIVDGVCHPGPTATVSVEAGPDDPSGGPLFFGDDLKDFKNVVQRVREILAPDKDGKFNDCAKFFQNSAVALKALNAFESKARIGIVDSPSNTTVGIRQYEDKENPTKAFDANGKEYFYGPDSAPAAAYRVFGIVRINSKGPFIDSYNKVKFGGYDAGETRSQVLQVLHELAHLVYNAKGPLIVNDGGDSTKSEPNTAIIKDACQKEIEASGKR